MAPELVSVVIPTYNCERFIGQAVRSALGQTYGPVEVIVVDDGSTDDTARELRQFQEGVRYIFQENRGLSAARNTGIRVANGEFVAFLDADDWWMPTKLARQMVHFGIDPDIVLVHSDVSHYEDERGCLVERDNRRWLMDGRCYDQLFRSSRINASTVVARRKSVIECGMFDEAMRKGCEDYDLWLRMAQSRMFRYVPERLAVYRQHLGGMSRNRIRMYEAEIDVVTRALLRDRTLNSRIGEEAVRQRLFELWYGLAYCYFNATRLSDARGALRNAAAYNGRCLHLYVLACATLLPQRCVWALRAVKRQVW